MRPTLALAAIIACTALAAVATAQETDSTQPQGSSVGDGEGGPPSFASAVRTAATRGGCRVRSFASDGKQHGLGNLAYEHTPPTSGTHAARWADWGVYTKAVKHQYQVHNLEHGGIVIHLGSGFSSRATRALSELVAAQPGYLVVTPRVSRKLVPGEPKLRLSKFPARGFVVTSWQRRLVCRSSSQKAFNALATYARVLRGTGPEQVPSFNSNSARPADLPAPAVSTAERRR